MNTTIDLKTAKTIEAMNQKINHMDNAVTDFFNKMSDVLERQLGDDEVYAAVIAPEIELTITPLANVRSYLPCFDEADSCYSISDDVPMALCYDPRQVITLAGKRYLSGAVVFVRYDTNGSFVALTTSDLYLIQCYLAENSVPLMAGREKMVCMQVSEDDETYHNPVDLLFEDLGKKKPKSFAVRQYKLYKLAAGKTAKSILISCGARLAPFDIQEVRDATMYDELELDKLGDRKTALFLIMSDTDSTFNFLISMIYTQLFNLLCDKADDVYGGKLPIHVRCLIDECANIGQIPQLEKLVATIRSREISACLVLQTRSQLKAIYKDNADTIVGNMDSQIFLGGSEPTTLKELSEALGKETIDSYNNSDTRGNSPSYGTNYQKLGHELLSRDEIAVLDGDKCILQLRGVRPFLSDKYDLTQHPNYKYTSDYDPKNALDIEKFLNRKEKIHPDDTFIMVDADSLPSA